MVVALEARVKEEESEEAMEVASEEEAVEVTEEALALEAVAATEEAATLEVEVEEATSCLMGVSEVVGTLKASAVERALAVAKEAAAVA